MNEACVTKCAPKRNTSYFELKQELNLEDIPPFPQKAWQSELNNLERRAIIGVYLKIIIDDLKGIRNEPQYAFPASITNQRRIEARKTKIAEQIVSYSMNGHHQHDQTEKVNP